MQFLYVPSTKAEGTTVFVGKPDCAVNHRPELDNRSVRADTDVPPR
jgi:hypothetical protein